MSEENGVMQRYYNDWRGKPVARSCAKAPRNKKPGGGMPPGCRAAAARAACRDQ
ncbi:MULTISPECIES: hypothetical protein [Burkholderia]|uniref:hypothetical protein n=1 Tax=Burkholderia TaxID=32008 RepID=UPI00130149B5|nr:hypothetical protein [Burkholderia contaminans]MBO1825661.1 hypothetical protein [Burkholderia contaminans]MBX3827201.1 hypothetical protein [Burkholderia contaminans]MBX3842061.1 hypothetical protein [Burkholderia contaminans]MBX3858437.1 hypothetical protein [Burkholderia contaminans]MBX3866555.1 hypothetical protein [Burkholderia contaminans]